ncbi:MAG: polysaccharide biosynthesis protein [Clostridiales bacterium]|nr:polysaccharide biosynthesis protein [Clostridiales bacterium]
MSDLKKKKTASFMGNVALVLAAQLIVKILGMLYRIVITNVEGFGDAGNGFYTAGFQIYTVLLAISSVGIPNALAKMVSERTALEDYKGAHRIFKTALLLFAAIGVVCSALLFFGADFIAHNVINMDGAQYTVRALSPSIFFVCVSSVVRGYFQGMQDMNATSRSQVMEQICKCTITILLVILAVGQPPEIMAAWANAASSIATFLSFGYLVIFYTRRQRGIHEKVRQTAVESLSGSTGKLMKAILMLSIPISLASIITAINRVIDTATITRGIEAAFAGAIPAHLDSAGKTVAQILSPTAKQLNDEAVRLAGMLSKSDTLINTPLSLNFAFATVLVPTIAGALAVGNKEEASQKASYSFLISILLILPCAIGYIVLAQPIYNIIYFNAPAGADLLAMTAVSLIFSALSQTMSGTLQGIGKVYVPAIGLLVGCVIKIILNVTLIRIPQINIYGAVISSIVCQFVAFLISFIVMTRYISIKITMSKYIIKPLIAGGIMGLAAWGVHRLILPLPGLSAFSDNLIAVLAAICIGALLYFFLIFALKILDKDEVLMLPGGTALYGLLKKLKLYKE